MSGIRMSSSDLRRPQTPDISQQKAQGGSMATIRPSGQQPKLRKSCDVCAATKVGCSKEKPTCSRCAKRGLKCSYSTARRAGRTTRTLVQTAALGSDAAASPTWETVDCSAAGLDFEVLQSPHYDGVKPSTNIFTSSVSPDDTNMLHALTDDFDLDGYFASMGYPLDGVSDAYGVDPTLFDLDLDAIEGRDGTGSGSISSNISSRSSSLFLPLKVDNTRITTSRASSCSAVPTVSSYCNDTISTTSTSILAGHHASSGSTSCQCHARAASLSGRLSASVSSFEDRSSSEVDEFQSIIAQNEESVDQIRTILQCSCSSDSDLLVTLSLLVFKLIARYTSATQAMSRKLSDSSAASFSAESRAHSPLFSTYYDHTDMDGEDQQRLAVQLILSKLTGVQVLVERLSQRLQGMSTPDQRADALSFHDAFGGSTGGMMPATQLISTELAYTLQADLRKRLHNLSQAIIERLQRS